MDIEIDVLPGTNVSNDIYFIVIISSVINYLYKKRPGETGLFLLLGIAIVQLL